MLESSLKFKIWSSKGGIYMKFSKSILIFLFVSSTLSAFYYALKRTDGNVYQSIMFTMYFLAIKIGLIAPNLPLKLDHHQPTQQLVSRVNKVELPGYHPYLSVYNDYRPSGLLMDSIERYSLVPQYSYSQDAINELRAGKSKVDADFEIEGPGPYDVADVKIPINWGKRNEDLKAAAERMGGKIVAQRLRMQDLGKTPLHIVDLRKLSPNEKLDYKQNLINTIGHSKDLVFLREETKI